MFKQGKALRNKIRCSVKIRNSELQVSLTESASLSSVMFGTLRRRKKVQLKEREAENDTTEENSNSLKGKDGNGKVSSKI